MTLHEFIVEAKASCYVGDGAKVEASRHGSHDLVYEKAPFSYRDSYFGGTDFIGQETVWENGTPVWAMNYYGRIHRDDLMTGADGGMVIRQALAAMYRQGRFLGGFSHETGKFRYVDTNTGDYKNFFGEERILVGGEAAYHLLYHGGLIRA